MSYLKASAITFEKRYSDNSGEKSASDDSGVEFAVRYWERRQYMEFEHNGSNVLFPVDQLEWLMDCLRRIREELPKDVLP